MSDQPWYRNHQSLWQQIDQHGSMRRAAEANGVNHSTISTWAKRLPRELAGSAGSGAQTPSVGAAIELEIDPTKVKWSDTDLMVDMGIDPETHIVIGRKAKRWNAPIGEQQVAELQSLALTVVPRLTPDMILPPVLPGWRPVKPRPGGKRSYKMIVVVSDTHAPYQDVGLEDCFNQFLATHAPARAYDLGDLLDLPIPSRHKTTRGFEASPQESIDERYRLDARRVAASPTTRWEVMLGNHDIRIDTEIQAKIGAHISRLTRAEGDMPVMDIGFLLRYDELGIKLLRPDGDYHSVTAKIVDGLNARHGTKAGVHGGAVKTMSRRHTSMLGGHDHQQMLQQHVSYDDENVAHNLISCSIGAMCQRDLGYVEDPNVAQGFAVITDHGDDGFHVELARWDDRLQRLYFRDEVYTPS